MEESISKRPLLGYAFTVLLFLVALLYTRVAASTYTLDGHKYTYIGLEQQTLNGKTFYLPIFEEVTH